jgi:hypothetical protein
MAHDYSLRHQYAAERLLENSALRDGLTDAQAQQMLDWGLALVERTAVHSQNLPDDDAELLLDGVVTAVSRVMKQVNRLTDGADYMDDAETADRLDQLWRGLRSVEPALATADNWQIVQRWGQNRRQYGRDQLFNRLSSLITRGQLIADAPHEEEE